jgi:aspartate ammonia-lyase
MEHSETRTECDLLGEIEVPRSALYGAQTQRAIINFPLHGERTIGHYVPLVEALLLIKLAAARANGAAGFLSGDKAAAIAKAAELTLEDPPIKQFPVHRLHGGGGTSANMNANEVLANVAEELLGGKRGEYRLIHPNDHVNLHQSTNDVYPTACHIAVLRQWRATRPALEGLIQAFRHKAGALEGQPRLARTCLQDAVEITFADLLGGYAEGLARGVRRVAEAVDRLHTVNLGGTIVGRRSDVPEAYLQAIIPCLREATGDPKCEMAADLFDAAQNPDDVVAVSATLDLLARGLVKVCQDLRLLNSGPEAGLGEVKLPAAQPGSSIMPGKINPVIPEFAIQLCFQAPWGTMSPARRPWTTENWT